VEDNPADVRLVRSALEEYEVAGELVVFRDGEKAIWFIEHVEHSCGPCPDLIIADLNLPKRPGRHVLECRDRTGRFRGVPAIVLSSSDTVEDRAECDRLGANLYVRKPTRLDEFIGIGATFREMLGLPSSFAV